MFCPKFRVDYRGKHDPRIGKGCWICVTGLGMEKEKKREGD